ncbi:ankyrin repeat domain-containing protein [Listeria sp. FSL L7-1517]|uniref:ankyrin repeat domain-containing protein n=1 Tax=Listeria immobilis TaxID=2713502 RepID=UPI00164E30B6|nr:ankyrin repeat domain-containing protein [Listeria immobilis]MBC6295597.1 ankyrin repeat domain-containing protein [Listeria immobilis]
MRIIDIFDAVREGSYEGFLSFFDKNNVNMYSKSLDLTLLGMSVANCKSPEGKLRIIKTLLANNADVNVTTRKEGRNPLHLLYFCNWRPDTNYMLEASALLVQAGVDVNHKDKYGAIPLKYVITLNKFPTEEIQPLLKYLLKVKSDYNHKDNFGKSCLDYAREYSWRNGFIDIVKEFEDENK